MKIRQNEFRLKAFNDIVPGTVFTWIDANRYYMKTLYCDGINAVCLSDNSLTHLDDDDHVTIIDGELVVN